MSPVLFLSPPRLVQRFWNVPGTFVPQKRKAIEPMMSVIEQVCELIDTTDDVFSFKVWRCPPSTMCPSTLGGIYFCLCTAVVPCTAVGNHNEFIMTRPGYNKMRRSYRGGFILGEFRTTAVAFTV